MLAARLGAWLRHTGERWAKAAFAEKLAVLLALGAVLYTIVTGAAELRYQARAREALAQVKAARLAASAVSAQCYSAGQTFADQTSADGFADGIAEEIRTLGSLPGTVTLLQIDPNGYTVQRLLYQENGMYAIYDADGGYRVFRAEDRLQYGAGWAMLLLELLLGLIRFLLGAALFSFMNVVAWRLPRGMDPLKGRSVCPQCGHTLGAPDLVPVFSWLFLRGRCRHCGAHIPARYLLVELLGGVLALGCTWRYGAAYALPGGLFGMSWAALLSLAVCGILLSVSLIDAETQTIPDRLNLALAVCGAVSVLLSPADWLPHIIGALCVSVPMFLLCLVIDGAFGGGDIKLMAAAGLFLGWQNTLLAMFVGIVFGGMYGIYLLAAKKAGKKDHFAFGPFLCAGIVIAMLFGGPVLEWYCAFL